MPIVQAIAYDYETGRILFYNEGEEHALVFPINPDYGWADGKWDAETHYVVNAVAVPRPATGLPLSHELTADTDWSLSDVPEGTLVLIDGEEAGTVDATGLTLSFALAGVWRVDLRPPFPWLDATCEVRVT